MNEMMTQHQIDDDYQADRSSSSLVPSSFLIDSLRFHLSSNQIELFQIEFFQIIFPNYFSKL